MQPKFKKEDRVCCLATRFDGEPDAQGRMFSDLHLAKEKTKWCFGTVSRVLGGKNFKGLYKVKWDGDNKQYNSHEEHLKSAKEIDDASESGCDESDDAVDDEGKVRNFKRVRKNVRKSAKEIDDASESGCDESDDAVDDEGVQGEDEGRDPEAGMDDLDPEEDRGEESSEEGGTATRVGGDIKAGGNTWKRVASMGEDNRGDRPRVLMSACTLHAPCDCLKVRACLRRDCVRRTRLAA